MFRSNPRLFKVLRMYCDASAIAAMGVGCLVLWGWALDIELLRSPLPGLVTMKANAALGLAFCGISLWLLLPDESGTRSRRIAHFLALMVVLVGAATLSEYLFGLNLRIDELLITDVKGSFGTYAPGRMDPTTAMALLALGVAMALLAGKTRRGQLGAQVLSLWAGLIAMMAITGYLYHAVTLYRILLYTQMALPTAIILLLLSGAVFYTRPETGIAGDLTGEGSGSEMARRFLPAVFLIPILLGWIRLRGQHAGWYGTEMGAALYATGSVIVFAVLVWLNARIMNVEYRQRSAAEQGIRQLNAELEGRVAERTQALKLQAAVLTEQAALLDLAQDAIVVRDMHNHVLSWNRGAEAMYGWLSKEAMGTNIGELLRTEFSEPSTEIEAKLLHQGLWEGEVIHHKRDGTRLVVSSRWTLQRDRDGAPARVLAINNDVTHRKEDESKLRLLTERLSLATAVAKVGVWEWDVASNAMTWDATMFDIYGFPPAASMRYERWAAAVSPEDLPAAEAALQRVIDEKGRGCAEYRIILPDGSVRNVSAIERVVLDEHGKVIRVIGVNMDVTERSQADAALRAAKESAEAANRSKSEFLANMSHEIRTPMNGIIGMAALALGTELTPEQRQYLEIVKSSSDSLLTIINDVLDFSKIEAGKFELEPIAFNLRDSIENTTETMALQAHQKGLELLIEIPADTPDFLVGDPARLRQILVNLLGNSIKFTQKGEIVVGVRTEDEKPDSVVLHFSVRDTGIGIPKDRQKIIFEAFTQADNSTTRKFGGTGLGLTIATRLVGLMGGRVWVESEPGNGSTFHFTASFGPGKVSATGATTPESVDLRGLRVLVVDDNSTNRRILKEVLTDWQMLPTLVEGGQEALAALEQARDSGNPFPLVLTDMQMLDMDGFALAQRIKENPVIAGAIIMMLTSAGQRGDAARCRELGIAAFLTKPVKQSELREAILAALGIRPKKAAETTLVTRYSLREGRHRFRILVAEDNPVNQTLAKVLLEKRGHTVVVASNGRQALEILGPYGSSAFDLVLMDVQMPEMDGFEATAAIREKEQSTGRHIPIVAITAHVSRDDQERCLAAGMDGYITKPIRADELFRVIESLVRTADLAVERVPAQRVPTLTDAGAALLNHVGGDVALLQELVGIFWGDCPRMLSAIREALDAKNPKALMRAAHALKGTLSNFGTNPAFETALKLETLGQEGSTDGAAKLFAELEEGLSDLKPALTALGKECGAWRS